MTIKVGIVGGTGYTGVELLRLLVQHPQVEVVVITSRSEKGVKVQDLYPNLRGHIDLAFSEPNTQALLACDAVFFATPHAVSMNMMAELMQGDVRIIDLSADFRLQDVPIWEQWYGHAHACPDVIKQAVYGLPEINRDAIKTAKLVASPGCYPTSVQLGFMPLLKNGWVDTQTLIANAASGVSGAGRQAKVGSLHAEVSDSFKAYAASGHRHLPEIEQGLNWMTDKDVSLTFVPHLLPMIRGIHSTLYATANQSLTVEQIHQAYVETYSDEPFVDVMPLGVHPETRFSKGSNQCRIGIFKPQQRDTIVVCAVIDNLVKGASGQAVQSMNIMFGFDETAGLSHVALIP